MSKLEKEKLTQIISMLSYIIDLINNINVKEKRRKSRRRLNLLNKRFGLLTVIKPGIDYKDNNGHIRTTWICKCDCGNITGNILTINLTNGNTASCGKCGIHRHEHTLKNKKSPTYTTWNCMKTRCYTQSHKNYHLYGGRGIKICDRWLIFKNFLEDMGERPSIDYQIHRIDKNKDYEPGNCIWVTLKEHRKLHKKNISIK